MSIEKGHAGGLVSKVRNVHSKKGYVISTAKERGKDYWTTVIFSKGLLGLPKFSDPLFTFVRNNKEEAHEIHREIKALVLNLPESEWIEKFPKPLPPEGLSNNT